MESPSGNTVGKGADPWKGFHTEKNSSLRARTHTDKCLAGCKETRRTSLSSGQQMPFRNSVTKSPVLGSRSRWVPRAAVWGTSVWPTSVPGGTMLLRVVPGQRHEGHWMDQLGDNAAEGRELTSHHWLYQPLCAGMQKANLHARSASAAQTQTYSFAVISRKRHSRGVRNKEASEGFACREASDSHFICERQRYLSQVWTLSVFVENRYS